MAILSFLKKRWWIVLIVLVIGGGLILRARGQNKGPTYETAPVERRDLRQTVDVTGEVKPAGRIELAFRTGGTIQTISVKIGDAVHQGNILATLENDDVIYAARSAAASLALARANLNARLAGETKQSIRVAETQVEQAQASLQKAQTDLTTTQETSQNAIKTAELAIATAKHNLDNSDATVSQTVQNAYDSARTSLLTALGPLQTGLTDGDQISGVDNGAANQTFLNTLGVLDSGSLQRSKDSYLVAKTSKQKAEIDIKALNAQSTKEAIQNAASLELDAIRDVQAYLSDVQKVLAATITSTFLTNAELTTKKSTIDADRASVSAQNTTVLAAIQTTKNTELTKTQTVQQLQDAYNTAITALDTTKANAKSQLATAQSSVTIQTAGLDAAQATLDLKRSPPREVDLAGLRASVDQAQAGSDKAQHDLHNIQIMAPADGIISDILPDVGEQISPNAIAIKMIGTAHDDIEALVPEADIVKVQRGQTATMTLDAHGDDVVFNGMVTAEDPDQTKVQEAVYYKIRVQIDPKDKDVKPGMTANVTIVTDERKKVLVIPLRAVRTKDADRTKVVRVLKNEQAEERTIELGLHGDEGQVEVTTGLNENEQVITGEVAP